MSDDKIIVSGSLVPNTTNTPLDARIRISKLDDIEKIQVPYIGMIFYVESEQALFVVKGLKSKVIGGREIPNMVIDSYEPVVNPEVEEAINNILNGAKQKEILNLNVEDTGKILTVDKDAKDNPFVKAVENKADTIKYSSENNADITTVDAALDYLMANIKNTTVDKINWNNVEGKPNFVDNLAITDNTLALRTGSDNVSTVELPTYANNLEVEEDKLSLKYGETELDAIPLVNDNEINDILNNLI